MTNAVIAGYVRSAFTPANKGGLARVRPDELAAEVVRALVARAGVRFEDIEDLITGCAFPEGEQGLNVARMIGLLAELDVYKRQQSGRCSPPRRIFTPLASEQKLPMERVPPFCGNSIDGLP